MVYPARCPNRTRPSREWPKKGHYLAFYTPFLAVLPLNFNGKCRFHGLKLYKNFGTFLEIYGTKFFASICVKIWQNSPKSMTVARCTSWKIGVSTSVMGQKIWSNGIFMYHYRAGPVAIGASRGIYHILRNLEIFLVETFEKLENGEILVIFWLFLIFFLVFALYGV